MKVYVVIYWNRMAYEDYEEAVAFTTLSKEKAVEFVRDNMIINSDVINGCSYKGWKFARIEEHTLDSMTTNESYKSYNEIDLML